MKSFQPGFLQHHPLSHNLLTTIHQLGEYKGKEDLFKKQYPQVLENLKKEAVIHSTESSNRIEGVTAPFPRIKSLVEGNAQPQNRSEQEIAGYKKVLSTVHENWKNMDFTPNVILQMHRDLFQFTNQPGGTWKSTNNEIIENRNGQTFIRFKPVEPHLTPEYMSQLHRGYQDHKQEGLVDPLLLIASYIMDFLCIHPFRDGNGRMARLIALWLLYKEGYEVGKYISLEKIIEQTKDGYYDTLNKGDQGWHNSQHNLSSWWEYFLGVMLLGAYKEFERRAEEFKSTKGAKADAIEAAIQRLPHRFTLGDVEEACPYAAHATIQRALRHMRDAGEIQLISKGRTAQWEKTKRT
ncbi:MAG: Fic family protein [Deltaproteobacteria bacterium]|nr:Fic family protein [Deltaproteobacteria bacterium]